MKYVIGIIVLLILTGCPVYDPPGGMLNIRNTSAETIYVYITCEEKLPLKPELELFFEIGDNVFDSKGDRLKDTLYYPNYRIQPGSKGSITISGTPAAPEVPCLNEKLNLFFISDSTMRTYNWVDIVVNKRYDEKKTYTQNQLEDINWTLIYVTK